LTCEHSRVRTQERKVKRKRRSGEEECRDVQYRHSSRLVRSVSSFVRSCRSSYAGELPAGRRQAVTDDCHPHSKHAFKSWLSSARAGLPRLVLHYVARVCKRIAPERALPSSVAMRTVSHIVKFSTAVHLLWQTPGLFLLYITARPSASRYNVYCKAVCMPPFSEF
jgi:hypothetical protein